MAADMCVAVAKYSHATGVKTDNTIPWTHVVASNVFLVLKGEDTHIQNGQLVLQVVQGNAVLEAVDIAEYVDQALEARHGSQKAGITPQIEQLPIFGIHKEVFLALRYRLRDGQARRVQFRLQSAQECSHLVGILERRGMEFQQQRPRTGRPSSARPETGGAGARPLTAQTYPAKATFGASSLPPKPSPFHLQTLEAGGLSSQTPASGRKTSDASQTTSRQPSRIPTTNNARQQSSLRASPMHTNHSMLASDQNGSDTTAARGTPNEMTDDYDNIARQQITSSSVRTATMLNAHDRPTVRETADAQSRAMSPEVGRPPSNQITHLNAPVSRSGYHNTTTAKTSIGGDGAFSNHSTSLYQPSAPASLRLPDTLEHEMPPRRELPFKRPGSHQSTSSRPSTSAKSASRSIAEADCSGSTVTPSTFSPAMIISTHRPATASPLKRAVSPSHLEPTKKALAVETRPQTQASFFPSASSPPRPTFAPTNDGSFRRPSDLGELLRIAKPLAERSPNSNKVVRLDSLADAPYELETPPGTSSSLSKANAHAAVASSPSRIHGRVTTSPAKPDSYTSSHPASKSTDLTARTSSVVGGPADSAESVALTDYASQSREDRRTVLDEFMVSKLEDPSFAVLCEDLDSCWRRIALGL